MTGRSRSGKMSARMRLTANTARPATARTATSTVIGRRSAARISHMGSARSPLKQIEQRREIAARDRFPEQRTPHVDTGQLVLRLGLREQTLRVCDSDDVAQTGLVAGARLSLALLGSGQLDRRIRRDRAGRV